MANIIKKTISAAKKSDKLDSQKLMELGFGILERISTKAMDIALAADKAEFNLKGLVVVKAPKLAEHYLTLAEKVEQAGIRANTEANKLGMAWMTLFTKRSFDLVDKVMDKLDINALVQKQSETELTQAQAQKLEAEARLVEAQRQAQNAEQKINHLRKEMEELRTRPVTPEKPAAGHRV